MFVNPKYLDKVIIKTQEEFNRYCFERDYLEHEIKLGINIEENQERLDEVNAALNEVMVQDDEE